MIRTTQVRIYRALLAADAMTRSLPPYKLTCKTHYMDVRTDIRVDGTSRMSLTHFATGAGHALGETYRELVPHERIRYTDTFDDPNLPGKMETTVILREVSCGTELSVTQQEAPQSISVELCYLGWQELLAHPANLAESEIYDYPDRRQDTALIHAVSLLAHR